MGFFGVVRVNGVPRFTTGQVVVPDGQSLAPGLGFAGQTTLGLIRDGANSITVTRNGLEYLSFNSGVGVAAELSRGYGWANSTASTSAVDTFIGRSAANTVSFQDTVATTNASTVLLGSVDFRQVASTFAQTATITNGPRAANPVAWVEVRVGGSTGRVPVW